MKYFIDIFLTLGSLHTVRLQHVISINMTGPHVIHVHLSLDEDS